MGLPASRPGRSEITSTRSSRGAWPCSTMVAARTLLCGETSSRSLRTSKDRVQVEAVNSPVNVGDARVHPGDLMRGDADGVLVIPTAHEEAVLAAAEEIDTIEQQIRAAIKDGKTLAEARRQLGYHQLQTRRK